jgi:hypothetical protein
MKFDRHDCIWKSRFGGRGSVFFVRLLTPQKHMKALLIIVGLGLASVGFSQTTNDYPKDSLKFAGYDSPDSTLETWTWAMNKGDKPVMLQTLTPEARVEWEKLWAGKTDEQMKAELAKGTAKFSGYTIKKREFISDDEIVVHLKLIGSDQIRKLDLRKLGIDWKIAGPK